MSYRFEVETQVGQDGMVHVDVPDVEPGQRVRVVVEDAPVQKERVFGRLRGLIEILPGFDDPIGGLEWAYGSKD